MDDLALFLSCAPGLEPWLEDEARALGLAAVAPEPGGVCARGGWPDVWRANRESRIAGHVLVRVADFRAAHLAQLDKRLRRTDWAGLLRADVPWRADASCRRSRIYHDRAARQRLERAVHDAVGTPPDPEAQLRLLLRIEDDRATVSLDTSGEPLHRRGVKSFVGKAPLRETMAAAFLRAAGFDGSQAVVDPMCGSGTFVLEAAAMAAGLWPGRARRFAFEDLANHDPNIAEAPPAPPVEGPPRFFGFDRDDGAIRGAADNAARAGVAPLCRFVRQPIAALEPPDTAPGLVMINPPYGTRIGDRKLLFALYGTLGRVLTDRFAGWRVGLVTSDAGLARATGVPFDPPGPAVAHGGLTVRLWTARLQSASS